MVAGKVRRPMPSFYGSSSADSHDMVTTVGYYPQNAVSLLARRFGHVAQRFVPSKPDAQDFARAHALQPELRAHEGHRANLAGNVDDLVGFDRLGGHGHWPNYTPPEGRCRVPEHA